MKVPDTVSETQENRMCNLNCMNEDIELFVTTNHLELFKGSEGAAKVQPAGNC